jgi:exodeoxyribonuclease V alpha subunit
VSDPSPRPVPGAGLDVFAEFAASGLWPGVGQAVAQSFAGAGITSASKVTVAALTRIDKMTPKRADRIYTSWIGAGQAYAVAQLLVPQEIPVRWAGRLMEALDDNAADQLAEDPWRLLALPDATVAQADRIALALDQDVQRGDPRRGRSLVDWTLARFSRQGHTAASVQQVADALRPFGVDAAAAIRAAVDADLVATVVGPAPPAALINIDGAHEVVDSRPTSPITSKLISAEPWVARKVLAQAEESIAEHLQRLMTTSHSLAGERAVKNVVKELDTVQAGAVTHAATHGVSILTGGPGTGKSRTIAAVVALCHRVSVDIALAAPTGRAAKRLEELAGSPASTIHRLLGARRANGAVAAGFDHDESNPIEAQLVVVDEASMLDVELAAALLSALKDKTHLVIVGDPAQLPSIGPGRVLGDLIDSGVIPVTELKTLYRQTEGGAIARLATAVREGELVPVSDPDHEVVIVPARGSEDGARRVVQLVTDSIPRVFGTTQGPGRHPGAEQGAEGGAQSGPRCRPRLRHRRPGGGHGQSSRCRADRLRQRRGRHCRLHRRQFDPGRLHHRRVRHLREVARRPPARVGHHRPPRAGIGVGGGRRRDAAGGRLDAVPSSHLHGADQGQAAPLDHPRRRSDACAGRQVYRGRTAPYPSRVTPPCGTRRCRGRRPRGRTGRRGRPGLTMADGSDFAGLLRRLLPGWPEQARW